MSRIGAIIVLLLGAACAMAQGSAGGQYFSSGGSSGGMFSAGGGSDGGTYVASRFGHRERGQFGSRLRGIFNRGESGGSSGGSYEASGGSDGGSGMFSRRNSGCENCGTSTSFGGCDCGCGCEDCNCNGNDQAAPIAPAPKTDGSAPATEELPTGVAPTSGITHAEQIVINDINAYRVQHGKSPLAIDPTLMRVCRERVNNVDNTGHDSYVYGSERQHAMRYANYKSVGGVTTVAHWSDGSVASPHTAMYSWAHSPGHARTVLGQENMNDQWRDAGFNRVGVAVGPNWHIAVFGTANDSARKVESYAYALGQANARTVALYR